MAMQSTGNNPSYSFDANLDLYATITNSENY